MRRAIDREGANNGRARRDARSTGLRRDRAARRGGTRAHRVGPAAGSQVSWRQMTSGSFASTYAKSAFLSRSLRRRPRRELAFHVTNETGSRRVPHAGGSPSPGLGLLPESGAATGAKKRFMARGAPAWE